jgi:hypothetical protein
VAPDDFEYGRALDLALGEELCEHRRLENAQADVEPDADQDEAQEVPTRRALCGGLRD